MSDQDPSTPLDKTVPEIVETLEGLDDAAIGKLLEDEKAGDNRVTLTDAIEAEQAKRKEAADEKAREEGFTDAAAKQAAEERAAAEAAKAKPKRQAKPKAAKENGFDKPAADEERAELKAAAREGATVFVTLGDDKGPDKHLPPVKTRLQPKRDLAVNASSLGFATGKLPRRTRFTHYFLTDAKGKKAGVTRELAAPIAVNPGEGVSFPAGTLGF